jgi:hypothetical protein
MYSYHLLFFPSFFSYLHEQNYQNEQGECLPQVRHYQVCNACLRFRDTIVTQCYVLLLCL